MKRKEQIDQIFQSRLNDYASPSPDHLWEKIDAKRSSRTKRPFFFRWRFSLLAFFLLLSSIGLYWMISGKHSERLSKALILAETIEEKTQSPSDIQNQIKEKATFDQKTTKQALETTPMAATLQTSQQDQESNLEKSLTEKPLAPSQTRTTTTEAISNVKTEKIASKNQSITSEFSSKEEQTLKTAMVKTEVLPFELKPNLDQLSKLEAPQNLEASNASHFTADMQEVVETERSKSLEKEATLKQAYTKQNLEALYLPTQNSLLIEEEELLRTPDESLLDFKPRGCYSFKGRRTNYNLFVDAFYSQEFAIRSLSAKDPLYNDYSTQREKTERSFHANSVGLRASIVFQNGVAFRTGLAYSQITEIFDYVDENAEVIEENTRRIIDPATGEVIDTYVDSRTIFGRREKTTYNKYRMLDIPVIVGYEWYFKKFSFDINAGAYINVLFKQKGDILFSDLEALTLDPVSITSGDSDAHTVFNDWMGVSLYSSVGFNYNLNQDVQLLVEPNIRFQLNSITVDGYPLDQQYKNIGLLVGIRFRI